MHNIDHYWINIWSEFNAKPSTINQIKEEIYAAYNLKNRYYHNLTHIEQILFSLDQFQDHIVDLKTLQLAVFFHDVVNSSKRSDNEEQSAKLAVKRLESVNYPVEKINLCEKYILSTKDHINKQGEPDLDYFLDADLEKLGAPWPEYLEYTKQIRKEYRHHPDFLYKSGRIKILEHFLSVDKIYKTEAFVQKYESTARSNIKREITLLKN